MLSLQSAAQVCSGSFGEPVVNLTFGTRAVPPASVSTNYTYTANGCPSDGSYTIASATSGCFGGNWHAVAQDHTDGDTDGNMMLINASNTPGEFFREAINDLCAGTTYEFAAYVMNVHKPASASFSKPDLTFIIESVGGTELSRYSTGVIPETVTPEWVKHGMVFTTPAGISQIVLKIVNNAPGGNGNDLALDDITFRACGPTITPSINGSLNAVAICEGANGSVVLNATVSPGYVTPAYQWQVNINNSGWQDIAGGNSMFYTASITAADAGGYQYRLTVAESSNIASVRCRSVSQAMGVNVITRPVVNAGPDRVTFSGRPVQLEGNGSGNSITYLWTPATYLDDPSKPNPIATPTEDMVYTLQVTNGCNVMVSDEVSVRVYQQIFIPNSFTPNGDSVNDVWNIAGLITYPECSVKIFNRYGDVIYSGKGYDSPWDGRYKGADLPQGVYYYIIDLNNGESPYRGAINIIR